MNKIIKDIVTRNCNKQTKEKELNSLLDDIKIAKGILSGKFTYCEKCDDYYLSGAFQEEQETKPCKVLVYADPINSGGNEYADGYTEITYSVCPKEHKKIIDETERVK